jgi:tetratricopeptide (TPR) repeat protein
MPGPSSEPETSAYDHGHYIELAEKCLRRGAFEAALRYYGRALEQDRERPDAWLGQVHTLLAMGQPEEAMTWMEQAAGIIGEVPALLALRAIAAARSGSLEDARAWSDRALRDGGDDPSVWLSRAEVLYRSGSEKMARVNLGKAHERAPSPLIALRCGEVALECGDLSGARPWLERAARSDIDSPMAALRLGVYWERAGDTTRAKTELSRALALEPELTAARLALADLNNRSLWQRLQDTFRQWSQNDG